MYPNHEVTDTFLNSRILIKLFLHQCPSSRSLYHKNQLIFLALISFFCALLLATIPFAVSLKRQHRAALGDRSLLLEYYEAKDPRTLSECSQSNSSSGHAIGTNTLVDTERRVCRRSEAGSRNKTPERTKHYHYFTGTRSLLFGSFGHFRW